MCKPSGSLKNTEWIGYVTILQSISNWLCIFFSSLFHHSLIYVSIFCYYFSPLVISLPLIATHIHQIHWLDQTIYVIYVMGLQLVHKNVITPPYHSDISHSDLNLQELFGPCKLGLRNVDISCQYYIPSHFDSFMNWNRHGNVRRQGWIVLLYDDVRRSCSLVV